jgi:large subunit ribosomal protein L21
MFAVVRTGGKQYRVAPGDKIVVEKLDGNAGDRITLGDVLLAGNGSDLKSTDGLTVAAEIVAQAKADKVTVFKKRRRHNYRRKKGHRQQHTILRIVAIGDQKEQKKAAPKSEAETVEKPAKAAAAPAKPPKAANSDASPAKVDAQPTENPAPQDPKAAAAPKAASKDKPTAETPSTKNAAPAKGAAKKSPKAK